MKIRREIAEVLQSASNRCAAKWKDLGAVLLGERERERDALETKVVHVLHT